MPADKSIFDIEKLKKDPELWKRLVMTSPDSDKVENVFLGKENPFDEHGQASEAKLETLAKEGRLYFREYGRSRHYNKVDLSENGYRLGEQLDAKMAGPYDPVLGNMLRFSRWMTKRLGLEKLSSWFDKFASRYDNYRQMKKMHKSEYKNLTDNEKENLNKRRDAEKAAKQAEEALKELQEKTAAAEKKLRQAQEERKRLDPLWAQHQEQLAAGNQPNDPEAEANRQEQPGELQEKQEQIQQEQNQQEQIQQEQNQQEQIQQEPVQQEQVQQEQVQQEQERHNLQENLNQQELQNQQEQEQQKKEQEEKGEEREKAGDLPEQEDQADLENISQDLKKLPPEVLKQLKTIVNQLANQENPQLGEMENLLSNPPDVLNKNGSAQIGRPKEQEQLSLKEQLAMEKLNLDAVKNWRETIMDSMFHSDANKEIVTEYERIRQDNADNSDMFLCGVVFGQLGQGTVSQEQQQIMDKLYSGQRIGADLDNTAQAGVLKFYDAQEKWHTGDNTAVVDMMSNTIRQLTQAASAEPELSARHMMIGRMISETFRMAQDKYRVELNLSDVELQKAKGALGLAEIVEKGMQARQTLGAKETIDPKVPENSDAIRDLLVFGGMRQNYQANRPENNEISSTQMLVGTGYMDPKKLAEVTGGSKEKQNLTGEQVSQMLKDPDGQLAVQLGQNMSDSFVTNASNIYEAEQKQKGEMEKMNEMVPNPV